ncbi:hypothetical protein EJD97_008445 [Solanum chilense]|uniref:Uncharacterized protein n=1 Tax=Solanum chilense TaxID=4083 RepID=A0A6N2BLT7_SOLCI|nr:hypothetical protein EJD97_008445 [Solanum chilense]
MRSIIQGPTTNEEEKIETSEIYHHETWEFEKHSFKLQECTNSMVNHHLFPQQETKEYILEWGLTRNGFILTSTTYEYIKDKRFKHPGVPNEKLKWIWAANVPGEIKTLVFLLQH